ncbi:MAG: hypothetical protein L3K13_06265 [Thermoplasmata archaeon]|nr:hypothetical protein [Thermoplasmata archaeon]
MNGPRTSRRVVFVAASLMIGVFTVGFVIGSITITSQSETGNGDYTGANALNYWTETSVGLSGPPGVLPSTLSGTVGTPTVLAGASGNYGINTIVSGDTEQFFRFSETTSAPVNTEVEVIFTVNTGAGAGTNVVTTTYIETQTSAPGSTLVFTLYYDLGSAASANIILNSAQQTSVQCGSVGSCP